MTENELTRLTKRELEQVEFEVAQIVGEQPTVDTLRAEGHTESQWLLKAIDLIQGTGRVITLLTAELIQAVAALVIAIVFAVLEYQRVYHGAVALGQLTDAAAMIAFAVVAANVIHPIYRLRQMRGQQVMVATKHTLWGALVATWRRISGETEQEQVDLYHNPSLHLAALVITWSTVFLAVYDILGPLLTQIFTGTLTRPVPIAVIELVMGLGLSIGGVWFLQSASHEIGVRILTDQPQSITSLLEQRRADHAVAVERVRSDVRARLMAAKLADKERRDSQSFFGNSHHEVGENANGRVMHNGSKPTVND